MTLFRVFKFVRNLVGFSTFAVALSMPTFAGAQAPSCEADFERCTTQRRAQCDSFQSTSDKRARCLEVCQVGLNQCQARQRTDAQVLLEIERAGGVKPGNCPTGYWIDGFDKKFGTFTCARYPKGDPKEAERFTCPPWLTKVSDHPAMFSCVVARK
jgi:hypothetical protein